MLVLIGGKEVDKLLKHVGLVKDTDMYDAAVQKVKEDLTRQTNQCMAQFKLMTVR